LEKITIGDVDITLAQPLKKKFNWIGQTEPKIELKACWLTLNEDDLPLTPRLIGVPGIGKTTLAAATAQAEGRDVYIMQCTADTRPEDLIITPVLSSQGNISYHASPLLTAAITGGVAILDEGNRMSEKSWASLAGLLDDRRSVESIVAGITIDADANFRCAVTMNEDDSTFEIPDYIISRLQPQIRVGFPQRAEELEILKYNIPFAPPELLELAIQFLQRSHEQELPHSIRDGLNAIRYTLKKQQFSKEKEFPPIFEDAIKMILGDDVFDIVTKPDSSRMVEPSEMNIGDLFFDEEDDLNPDFGPDAS
jgi:MoxR-like ATPase